MLLMICRGTRYYLWFAENFVLCESHLPTQKNNQNANIGHENATDQINRRRTVFENSDDDDDLINTRSV